MRANLDVIVMVSMLLCDSIGQKYEVLCTASWHARQYTILLGMERRIEQADEVV